MKVLWICNCPNKTASTHMGEIPSIFGGWLTGMSEALAGTDNLDLVYCFPKIGSANQEDFVVDSVHYYSFFVPKKYGMFRIDADKENIRERREIKKILEIEKPDLVHIFGTEYIHSLMMAEEFKNKENLICSIQGLTSMCAKHYLSLVPSEIWHKTNFATFFRKTLWGQKKTLESRGKREIRMLQLCPNVIGRTEWDRTCTFLINQNRIYYKCNEILRKSFYNYEWDHQKCQKYTIFVSQGSSPLKGFSVLIEAVALLKKEFPDVILRVAGNNFIDKTTLLNRMKISTYGEYIRGLIKSYSLEGNIMFLGGLEEDEIIKEYLNCNVFASSSSIENSSNSVCEAMLLGVPVVSSYVGGIPSLLENELEGLLYQGDAAYMAAEKICRIFRDEQFAKKLGEKARIRALNTHNPRKNTERVVEIYQSIYQRSKHGSN